MAEAFEDIVCRHAAPRSRLWLPIARGHGSPIAIACVLGLFAAAPAALAETDGNVGRAALLVDDERAAASGQRLAQSVGGGFAVEEISGQANTAIPVQVQIPEIEEGVYNFLVFRNLPNAFEMSAGFPVEDRWVVPLDQIENLTIKAPGDYRGSFELEIKLRIGGTDKSQTLAVPVRIFAPGENQRPARTASSDTSGTQGLSEETEKAMMARAQAMLDTRDVAGARMIYEYLVQKGSGQAAYGMAQTYDPAFVEDIGVAGMNAQDLEQAKKWYERAALLGHKQAQERLKVMAAGTQ